MIIETTWGPLEIDERDVFHFSKGIPGFAAEKDFVLISNQDDPFQYLQSTREKYVSFLITDPFLFYRDYEFELQPAEVDELKIEDEMLVRSIITLKDPVEKSTINLLAPIVLNPKLQIGKQVVLHTSKYGAKQELWNMNGRENARDVGSFT
ncbi:flagellar assembly protein FliW [Paenibacillus azoreducens]|uniref:Flagellar assembly factor FliW n=1 Tax=Paenibacillus azoreducens TaxID=116718 RepID=A0A919YDX2_9BACL|nr:flagellar assembly protein FliW [Paenibacillus azoreducens]GIO48901.1 flagellar assembly factor FliW [Paenibacillus azoreducens]